MSGGELGAVGAGAEAHVEAEAAGEVEGIFVADCKRDFLDGEMGELEVVVRQAIGRMPA